MTTVSSSQYYDLQLRFTQRSSLNREDQFHNVAHCRHHARLLLEDPELVSRGGLGVRGFGIWRSGFWV